MGSRGPIPRSATTPMPVGPAVPPPPRWLPDGPASVWQEIAPALHSAGRLWPGNHEVLANYVQCCFELRRLAVEIDGGPLTDRSGHGPVCSGSVTAAIKLRGVLATLAKALGLDHRGVMDAPPAVDQPPSLLQQWQARHPARQG